MADIAIPRMTRPWRVVAVAMAGFGFVYGYVGSAGAPFCASMGQCLQDVVDAGPPWFYPEALIPGAIAALIFAAFVYVLFLLVSGVRWALGRPAPTARPPVPHVDAPPAVRVQPSARTMHLDGPPAAPARHLHAEPPPARHDADPPVPAVADETPAVAAPPHRRRRPTPLLLAIGAALVWAVLSVGPAALAADIGQVIPRDAITAPVPFCAPGYRLTPTGTCTSTAFSLPTACQQLGT
ncbi:MAG: hypothetical protein FJ038_12275, partial [Chloroflexi bacterium]|nr:hypothetical protein [Chloroflexota bacterium]